MSITAVVPAVGTLTVGASVPTANDTVTIGHRAYTWKAAPTTVADEVKIGATVAISCANLAAAINLTGTSGTDYGSGTTINALVSATATATTVVVTAKTPGVIGNEIITTESGTNTAWGAALLASGSGAVDTAIGEILSSEQVNASVITILKSIDGSANTYA